jgi:TolB protein
VRVLAAVVLLLVAESASASTGERIAFAARGAVWTIAPDGATAERVRPGSWPDWSPDGLRIAFAGSRGIYVMNADGSHVKRVTRGLDLQPDWSPDGRRIAFARIRPHFGTEIEVVGVGGGPVRALTSDRVQNLDPAWSPDGRLVAFDRVSSASRFARPRIVAADLTGKVVRRLGEGSAAAWSPDGSGLAFTGSDGAVWIERADGTRRRRLVAGSRPAWSPDGAEIAYVAETNGQTDVWIMDADGGNQRRLTAIGASEPDWSR